MAIARALLVDIASNTAKIRQDIAKVRGDFESLGKTFSTVGKLAAAAFSVQQVLSYAKAQINLADSLNKTAQKVGVSVEALSAYQYAASLAGSSTEEVTKALSRLARGMQDAVINPAGEGALAFRVLGVSVTDAGGRLRDTQAVFEDVAKRFSEMQDGAGKTALAMQVFGKSGAELLPLLNQLKELKKEAEAAGVIVSSKFAKDAEDFNDNIERMQQSLGKLTRSILQEVVPALNEMLERINVGIGSQSKLSLGLLEKDRAALVVHYQELARMQRENINAFGEDHMKTRVEGEKAALRAQIDRVDQLIILSNKELAVRKQIEEKKKQIQPDARDIKGDDKLLADAQRIQTSLMTETEVIKSAYADRLGILLTAREQELISQATFLETKERLELEHRARMKDVVAQNELAALNVTQMSTQGQIESVLQRGIAMTAAGATASKKMFAINKALALANAAIALPDAVMGAYAFGARIGGPVLGAAMGALAGAAQLAQMSKIKSASFGSATSAASVGGGGATPVTNADAGGIPGPTTQSNLPTQNITVNVQNGTGDAAYWQDLIDSVIVPGLGDAQRRNVNLTIR